MDPDGKNHGYKPIPIYCKLPEALAIYGEEVEIPIEPHCPNHACFNHPLNYDQNTLEQIIALTKISSKCTQSMEFHCLSAPLKDLVSWIVEAFFTVSNN